MKMNWIKNGVALSSVVFVLMGVSGCISKPQGSVSQSFEAHGHTSHPMGARELASVRDQIMEDRFQAMIQSPEAEKYLTAYADRLFDLLIEINRNIFIFDQELDESLKILKNNPQAELPEPLQSATYQKLWKMWQLKDRYTAEIAWFYLRILQTRTDSNISREERMRVRTIHRNLEKHLLNSQDVERVELQPLMKELAEVYKVFVEDYKERRRAQMQGSGQSSSNSQDPQDLVEVAENQMGFSKALFGTEEDLKKYIQARRISPMATKTEASERRRRLFLKTLDQELLTMPELVVPDREPQNVQDLTCGPNKKICASPGDATGNIIGRVFPAGVWSLTYDDGPGPETTSQLMDILKNYSDPVNPFAKATFFWLAKQVQAYPSNVEKALKLGFQVENHSFTHANLANLNTQGRRREVIESNRVITEVIRKTDKDYRMNYFRCPYGSCYAPKVPEVRQMIANQGQVHAYWRIDSMDWKLRSGPKVAELVIKQMQLMDRGVILMHDIHPSTVEATKIILNWVKKQNTSGKKHRLVNLSEAVDMANGL